MVKKQLKAIANAIWSGVAVTVMTIWTTASVSLIRSARSVRAVVLPIKTIADSDTGNLYF
jgi:hypothetical protein